MGKNKSGEKMYGEKIVGPKGHIRHAGTTHKREGKAATPHPTGMHAYSGARRNKLQTALEAREEKVAKQRKKSKGGGKVKGYKKGGPITYRMTGGQVVGNSYD